MSNRDYRDHIPLPLTPHHGEGEDEVQPCDYPLCSVRLLSLLRGTCGEREAMVTCSSSFWTEILFPCGREEREAGRRKIRH